MTLLGTHYSVLTLAYLCDLRQSCPWAPWCQGWCSAEQSPGQSHLQRGVLPDQHSCGFHSSQWHQQRCQRHQYTSPPLSIYREDFIKIYFIQNLYLSTRLSDFCKNSKFPIFPLERISWMFSFEEVGSAYADHTGAEEDWTQWLLKMHYILQ